MSETEGLFARIWHKVLGDLLEEISGEDPGLAARVVVHESGLRYVARWRRDEFACRRYEVPL